MTHEASPFRIVIIVLIMSCGIWLHKSFLNNIFFTVPFLDEEKRNPIQEYKEIILGETMKTLRKYKQKIINRCSKMLFF